MEKFNISQWRSASASNFEVPPDALMRMAVDPSMTANPVSSDQSTIAVGFCDNVEAGVRLTLMDIRVGWWKAMELPQQIVNGIREWKVEQTDVERIPGSELLVASVELLAELQKVPIGRVRLFNPCNRNQAKPSRIRRLQGQLDRGLLRIRYGLFVDVLFTQAEQYLFTTDNCNREDGALDALAMLCGFR